MHGFETLIYRKEGSVARVTLNRPEALNAYNIAMRDELFQVLQALHAVDSVRAVIVGGAGEKAFCAGADLSEFLTAPSPVIARSVRWARDVWGLFLSLPQPVIAAVHGFVLGDGIEIMLCCDIAVAAAGARFGLPEPGLGIIPAAGGTQTVPRAVGPGLALDMMLCGRWLDASEALAAGLVNRVVSYADLEADALRLATAVAALEPGVTQRLKLAVRRGLDLPLGEGLKLEKRLAAIK
jgi:enoyl-CoA hydratase/carnithine racemase